MMVWAYAGWTGSELDAFMAELHGAVRADRIVPVLEIASWAQAVGARRLIVSASPHAALKPAAQALGFSEDELVGGEPRFDEAGRRVQPRMAGPLPYGQDKARLGRHRLGARHWLASFGDSIFDAEMLNAAEIGVMVEPKPELRDTLQGDPKSVRLLI
jgi:phosphoserine phosphatase